MEQEKITLSNGEADGYVVPLRGFNMVMAVTATGLIGCGVFDKFNYPAARVRSKNGSPVATVNDLLSGVVSEANETASNLGVNKGMNARTALELV